MKSFRIKQLLDQGRWVPEDPELRDLTYFVDDGQTTRGQIREMLFHNINLLRPGEYQLDQTIEDGRQEVFQRIDTRTSQLIERGFEYQGIVFSISLYAQSRYNFMLTTAIAQLGGSPPAEGFYPLAINSLDDTAFLTLTGPVEMVGFCGAAANYVRDQIDSGTALKDAVRAATTQEELDAFVDNRGVEQLPPEEPPAEEPPPEEPPPEEPPP